MRRSLFTLVLATLVFITGCEVNPATGRRQLMLVNPGQLDAMGAEAAPMLVQEYGGEVPQTELREYISQIGNRLARHVEPEFDEVQWTFITLDSDVINAFALPGGRVFISRGLLAHLSNEAEVAAVLGHEIGHVTGRHVDERISRATAVELGLALGGAMTESQVAQMVGGLFGQGYLLSFGREQELEADRLGLRYMTEAGYDPHAMLGVLRVLMESRGPGGGPPEILSTHPNPERRLELVQNLLDQEYSHTRDNPEFRLFEGRFRQNAAPHVGARTASLGAIAEGKRPRCCPH